MRATFEQVAKGSKSRVYLNKKAGGSRTLLHLPFNLGAVPAIKGAALFYFSERACDKGRGPFLFARRDKHPLCFQSAPETRPEKRKGGRRGIIDPPAYLYLYLCS